MDWLTENWFWVGVLVFFLWMHRKGGCGGHGGHRRVEREDEVIEHEAEPKGARRC